MGYDIRQQINLLVKLQRLELDIRRDRQVLNQVDTRMAALDDQLKEFTAAVENGKARGEALAKTCRALESELQINQGRVAKSQDKLRAVKTNKEYQMGLKEIDDLGAIGSNIEDDILACLEEIETVNMTLAQDQKRLDTQAELIRREKSSVQHEAQETNARLVQMEKQASELSARVDPGVLALYRRVQAKKPDHVGIASVCDSVCRGCNVNIPPQMYNELQRFDRLKNCPNCERLIYCDKEDDRSE